MSQKTVSPDQMGFIDNKKMRHAEISDALRTGNILVRQRGCSLSDLSISYLHEPKTASRESNVLYLVSYKGVKIIKSYACFHIS